MEIYYKVISVIKYHQGLINSKEKRACNYNIVLYTKQNSNQLQNGTIFSNISCYNAIVCTEVVTIFSFAVKFDGYPVTCPLLLGVYKPLVSSNIFYD